MASQNYEHEHLHLKVLVIVVLMFSYVLQPYVPNSEPTFAHSYYDSFFDKLVDGIENSINSGAVYAQSPIQEDYDQSQFLELEWSINNNPLDTSYLVQHSLGTSSCSPPSSGWSDLREIEGSSDSCKNGICSTLHEDLDGNTCYCYRVSSRNTDNKLNPSLDTGTFDSNNMGCAYTLPYIPSIPTFLMGKDTVGGYHSISWGSNGNSDTTDYQISYDEDPVGREGPLTKGVRVGAVNTVKLYPIDTVHIDSETKEPLCDPENGDYHCLLPNEKTGYRVSAFNDDGVASSYSQSSEKKMWSPVNFPDHIVQSPIGSEALSNTKIKVSWVRNANPVGTSYVLCRTTETGAIDEIDESSYQCVQDIMGVPKKCLDLTVNDLGPGGCKLIEDNGEPGHPPSYIDTISGDALYTYKVIAVNNGCEVSESSVDSEQCFISQMSNATTNSSPEYLFLLDTKSDFLPGYTINSNRYSSTWYSSNLRVEDGSYGNGILTLDTNICVDEDLDGNCEGVARYTFDPSFDTGTSKNEWLELKHNSKGARFRCDIMNVNSGLPNSIIDIFTGEWNDCSNISSLPKGKILVVTIVLEEQGDVKPFVDYVKVTYDD